MKIVHLRDGEYKTLVIQSLQKYRCMILYI